MHARWIARGSTMNIKLVRRDLVAVKMEKKYINTKIIDMHNRQLMSVLRCFRQFGFWRNFWSRKKKPPSQGLLYEKYFHFRTIVEHQRHSLIKILCNSHCGHWCVVCNHYSVKHIKDRWSQMVPYWVKPAKLLICRCEAIPRDIQG